MGWQINGNMLIAQKTVELIPKLPLGTYYLRFNPQIGYFLEKVEDFILPKKIYGDTSIVNRWLTSFNDSPRNTGILLSGIKGSGKTLLSKKVAIDSGLPIIIIDTPYNDSDFISFITNPELGSICIFVDEFEKVFARQDTESALLSILDGSFNMHNLFVFTCNEMHKSKYLINRPSRIRYRSHFESLAEDVIAEVVDDLLINKEHTSSVLKVLGAVGVTTFDILITLIKEMNLFNESAEESCKYLNLQKEEVLVEAFEIHKGQLKPLGDSYTVLYLNSGNNSVKRNFDKEPNSDYKVGKWVPIPNTDDEEWVGFNNYVNINTDNIKRIDLNTWETVGKDEDCEDARIILKRKYIKSLVF